jgi:small-conductance mechanosensitive channel
VALSLIDLERLILGSIVIVAFFALVGELTSRGIRRLGRRAGVREVTLVGIRDISRVIWIVLAIFAVAYYTDLTSDLTVLAVSTVGGLIVSLALQATLSNVIAGLFMLEDGTLRVGDEVSFSSQKGRVIRITLRTTWIMNEKGTIVVVSNSNLMGGPLIVHTATTRLVPKYHLEGLVPPTPETKQEISPEKSLEKAPENLPEKVEPKAPVKRVKKGTEKESDGGRS